MGRSRGPLVILQHGGGQTRHAWKNVGGSSPRGSIARSHSMRAATAIRTGRRRPLQPGRNDRGPVSLVAALGNPRPRSSAPRWAAARASSRRRGPRRREALVLVDIAPRVEPEGVDRIQASWRSEPEGFDTLEEVADAIASYQPHRARPRRTSHGLAKNVRRGRTASTAGTGTRGFSGDVTDSRKRQLALRGVRGAAATCPCARARRTCRTS